MSPRESQPRPKAALTPSPVLPPQRAVEDVKALLTKGKRDAVGFVIDDTPSLSEQQLLWLMFRLGTRTDDEACAATYAETESPIDLSTVTDWRADPTFEGIYQTTISNKREAFRYIGGQMLPKALRVMWGLMSSTSARAQVQGLQLLLRSQGLLIDKVERVDPEALNDLVTALRTQRPLPSITVLPRLLPPADGGDA
jgi:hypothetical protein